MKYLLVCIFLMINAVSLFAFEGSADLGTSFYLYEVDSTFHAKFYQSLKTSLVFSKDNLKKISFHSYGRWRNDFANQDANDPQVYLYDAYFKFSNYIAQTKIQTGRQFTFTPIGTALLDGIGLDSYITRKLQLKLAAGAYVDRAEPDKVRNFSENLTLLSRLTYNFDKFKTGANYLYKKRDDKSDIHNAGIDFSINKSNYSFYTRGTYDIELLQFHEFLIRGSYQNKKTYFSSEFLHKKPSISSNSVFAIIDARDYKRIRFDFQYKLNPDYKIITEIRNSFYNDDNILGGYIGISASSYSLMYNFQTGQGTKNSGLSGTISHKINKLYSVYGSANLYKYKIQDEVDETSESYAAAFGFARPIGTALYLRVEYQYLRNAIESSNQRIYLKLNRQFKF